VITDIDCHASANEIQAAALRHIKKKGGGYIQIPHDWEPANELEQNGQLLHVEKRGRVQSSQVEACLPSFQEISRKHTKDNKTRL
jgi:hypothetical protein